MSVGGHGLCLSSFESQLNSFCNDPHEEQNSRIRASRELRLALLAVEIMEKPLLVTG
jgi:hypothetical protein